MPFKRLRQQSKRVRLENSGQVLFIYDRTHGKDIEAIGPKILDGFGASEKRDKRLGELAERRLMVACELPQDDDIDLEVVIGKALTAAELRAQPALTAKAVARLALPSGKLRLESYDSLTLCDGEPEARGKQLSVEPGEYTCTVYRVDPLHPDAGEAHDVLVLTARASARGSRLPAFVPFSARRRAKRAKLAAKRKPNINDGVWTGTIVEADCEPVLDFTPEAAKQLDLRFGAELRVALGGGRSFKALYLGDKFRHPDFYFAKHGTALLDKRPRLKFAWWCHDEPRSTRLVLGTADAWAKLKRGSKATISTVDAAPPETGKVLRSRTTKGVIEATVTRWIAHPRSVCGEAFVANVDRKMVVALGVKLPAQLKLAVGKGQYLCTIAPNARLLEPAVERARKQVNKRLSVRDRAEAEHLELGISLDTNPKSRNKMLDQLATLRRTAAEQMTLGGYFSDNELWIVPLVPGCRFGFKVKPGTSLQIAVR